MGVCVGGCAWVCVCVFVWVGVGVCVGVRGCACVRARERACAHPPVCESQTTLRLRSTHFHLVHPLLYSARPARHLSLSTAVLPQRDLNVK